MKRNILLLGIIAACLFVGGCESLEDTYGDMAGHGKIRYLGKCNITDVKPGWNRLTVEWENSIDPMIEKIKVAWKYGDVSGEAIVDNRNDTSYDIPNLTVDGVYEIRVSSMDADGNISIASIDYGRPYTEDHEDVRLFSSGITKSFKLGNNTYIVFDTWSDNIVDYTISYRTTGGDPQTKSFAELKGLSSLVLKDIDTSSLTIERKGKLEGCEDIIEFEKLQLEYLKAFSPEFKVLMEKRYGIKGEITDQFLESVTEMEYDYSIRTMEDILYFPNLKTLVLGKNRYLNPDPSSLQAHKSAATVAELAKSIEALKVATELLGVEIIQYNKHFFPEGIDGVVFTEMGNPDVPMLNYLDGYDWDISNDADPYSDWNLFWLLDDMTYSVWSSSLNDSTTVHNVVIDMLSEQTINGFKVVQMSYDEEYDGGSADLMIKKMQIKVSDDNIFWRNSHSYTESHTLGETNGETTLIHLDAPVKARYIKLVFEDNLYREMSGNFNAYKCALADFIVF